MQIYRGPHCSYRASGLLHGTEYLVRVFAVRLGKESGDCERVGAIGLPTSFGTLSARPSRSGGVSSVPHGSISTSATPPNVPRWSDQQWAILLLVTFTLCAVLIAFLTQQVLLYAASGSATMSSSAASTPDEVKYAQRTH